jgi:serine phosphatase RsbU (regulator of sigma subunit)/anti-sigma regulatory factor (Ser/Thr protein kinase)
MSVPRVYRRAFERTLPGAGVAARWLDEVAAAEGIGGELLYAIEVCLEELFSNIVRHGAPPASFPAQVFLTLEIDPVTAVLTVADDGQPFDVSKAPARKADKPLSEITPGGLGVLLAKSYSAGLTYRREGTLNIVRAEFPRTARSDKMHNDPASLNGNLFRSAIAALPAVDLEPGAILIRQGEASGSAYFLKSGSAAVYAETSYGPVTLATCQAPRLLGEIGVLAGLPRTASVKILTPAVVVPIARAALLDIARQEPQILVSVIGELGKQINGVNQAIGLYTNALAALEKREFDEGILADLNNPTPELAEFAAAFRRFADQIVHKRRQQDEMASAAAIQQSLLPGLSLLGLPPHVELFAAMRPARQVGGDFYDALMLDERRLAIIAGDVCGKGMPASLFMAVAVTVLRIVARQEKRIEDAVRLANAILCTNNPSSMFATVLYGVLDIVNGAFEYCVCGHPAPLVIKPDGDVKPLPGGGLALGMLPQLAPQVFHAKLSPGETLFVITDGVTEANDKAGEEFGESRLVEALAAAGANGPEDCVTRVFSAVDDFALGTGQFDDITCIAVRLTGCHGQAAT